MACVVLQNGAVELGDELAARPVPELEDRRDQADARHVVRESVLLEQIKRCRMGRGGARIGLQFAVVVEHHDRQATPPQQPGAQEADRTAARDQYAPVPAATQGNPVQGGPSRQGSRRLARVSTAAPPKNCPVIAAPIDRRSSANIP